MKMQIKIALRFHLILIRMAKEKQVIAHANNDVEQSSFASVSANLRSHFGNYYGGFSENWELIYFKTQLYHPRQRPKGYSIIPQGHLLNSTMFTATLFIIDRN